MTPIQIRRAGEEDNAQLLQLTRDSPVQGRVSFYQERAPRFFALCEIQGESYRVYVAESDRRIVGSVSCALRWTYINGAECPTWYLGDLKIAPDMRGKGVLREFINRASESFWSEVPGADLGFSLIVKTNPASRVLPAGRAYMPRFVPLGTIRNYAVHLLSRKKGSSPYEIVRAAGEDAPAMAELMQKVFCRHQFAPVIDLPGFLKKVEQIPGLGLHNFYLAKQRGRIRGLVAAWDQQSFKKIKLLSFSPGLRISRSFYNFFTRIFAFRPMPEAGNYLPYFYLSHLAIVDEDPAVFRALMDRINNDHCYGAHLFFTFGLPAGSPLARSLHGYFYHTFDMLAFAIMPEGSRWQNKDLRQRPLYVDSAFT